MITKLVEHMRKERREARHSKAKCKAKKIGETLKEAREMVGHDKINDADVIVVLHVRLYRVQDEFFALTGIPLEVQYDTKLVNLSQDEMDDSMDLFDEGHLYREFLNEKYV